MDYDAVAAHFLMPTEIAPPEPKLPDTPARRLRDAMEPIATIGWWSREAAEAVTRLGHDFFDGYVWGRAASLGVDVSAPVVVSAFGWFEPSMLTAVYAHGRSISSRDTVLDARSRGATAGLRAATGGVGDRSINVVAELLDTLDGLDGSGRPLFAALRDLPRPATTHGRAWRAAELIREHRGVGNIAATVTSGLGSAEANVLTELWLGYAAGEYSATRGLAADRVADAMVALRSREWIDESGALTVDGRRERDAIEAATDRSESSLISALGDRIDGVILAAETISAAIIAHHAAPADPRKRAAG